MKLPIIISAFEGTFDKRYIEMGSKYKFSITEKRSDAKANGWVNGFLDSYNKKAADVYIIPAESEIQQELFNRGYNFAMVYPADNACGPFQDRLDEMKFPEDDIVYMIKTWNSRVKDHTWRQLAKKVEIISDTDYIDDAMIDSFLQ